MIPLRILVVALLLMSVLCMQSLAPELKSLRESYPQVPKVVFHQMGALDHQAQTIARLLVENIVCRHRVPQELLSDRGSNFLSDLMLEVCS